MKKQTIWMKLKITHNLQETEKNVEISKPEQFIKFKRNSKKQVTNWTEKGKINNLKETEEKKCESFKNLKKFNKKLKKWKKFEKKLLY